MHHISEEDFKTINWLPIGQRVQQNLNVTGSKGMLRPILCIDINTHSDKK